jgi:hypothetical protein
MLTVRLVFNFMVWEVGGAVYIRSEIHPQLEKILRCVLSPALKLKPRDCLLNSKLTAWFCCFSQ